MKGSLSLPKIPYEPEFEQLHELILNPDFHYLSELSVW